MFSVKEITIIVPSIGKKISKKWIYQINHFCKNNISVVISIPPGIDIKKVYSMGFSKDILIVNSDRKGQVFQRQFAYKYSKNKLIMHMDDDIFFNLDSIKGLLEVFNSLPENSCLAPAIKNSHKRKKYKSNLFFLVRNLILYSELNPIPGSISSSSLPIPYYKTDNKNMTQKVEWLPGGITLIRKKHCIKDDYFKFSGKAYCEDLFLSRYLRKNKINLYINNKFSFKTKLESYRSLNLIKFIKFIINDFRIRNFYRKNIKKRFIPLLFAYFYLIFSFLITKFIKLFKF